MDTLDFKFIFLGQSVLRYQVPWDIYNIINDDYRSSREGQNVAKYIARAENR